MSHASPRTHLLVLAMGLGLAVLGCTRSEEPPPVAGGGSPIAPVSPEPKTTSNSREGEVLVSIAGQRLELEVAADWDSRGRGLSGRRELAPDGGMIFVYPRAEPRSFWMKGCLIGLDVAFVDDRGHLIEVISLDPPAPETPDVAMPRARCDRPARFVIETRKGWFEAHKIVPGAVVELPPEVIALAENGDEDV